MQELRIDVSLELWRDDMTRCSEADIVKFKEVSEGENGIRIPLQQLQLKAELFRQPNVIAVLKGNPVSVSELHAKIAGSRNARAFQSGMTEAMTQCIRELVYQ